MSFGQPICMINWAIQNGLSPSEESTSYIRIVIWSLVRTTLRHIREFSFCSVLTFYVWFPVIEESFKFGFIYLPREATSLRSKTHILIQVCTRQISLSQCPLLIQFFLLREQVKESSLDLQSKNMRTFVCSQKFSSSWSCQEK